MRIDLSPKGRVVGTKKVSPQGSVAGLLDYAGQDVLILLPNGRPVLRNTARDYLHEWERVARRNAKRASKEYQSLRRRLPSTREALRLARTELRWNRLVSRLPVKRARATVRRRVKEARRQADRAEAWVRANIRLPRTAPGPAA